MSYQYDVFISYRKKEPPKDWVFEYFYKYLALLHGYSKSSRPA
jgi:hypothetical protein